MKPRRIFFDFGGTLVSVPFSLEEIWLELLKGLSVRVDSRKFGQAAREADLLSGPRVFDYKR